MQRLTFKDLKKRVSLELTQQQSRLFERLQNKPFWIWDKQQHRLEDIRTNGLCCFNHIIGLATKEDIEKAVFDYEKILYDALLDNDDSNILHHTFKRKHLWVKKATGLGVTYLKYSMGIGPAYGSSAFGIVVTEWADGIVQIRTAAEEFTASVPKDYIMFHYRKIDVEACLIHLSFSADRKIPVKMQTTLIILLTGDKPLSSV